MTGSSNEKKDLTNAVLYWVRAGLKEANVANVQALFALAMPVAMFAGGIAAWRASKRQDDPEQTQLWRDDSLDDWRKERDAAAEERRKNRATEEAHLSTGSEEQQETKKHHQRLGG